MYIDEFLSHKRSSVQQIVSEANLKIDFGKDDVLLVVGSLADGLGNLKSDLDLMLIKFDGLWDGLDKSYAWQSGSCLVDMEIVPIEKVNSLSEKLISWSEREWDDTYASELKIDDRKFLHRILCGIYLGDPDGAKKKKIVSFTKNQLSRLKFHSARHLGRTIQVDMAGYKFSNDLKTLVYASHELLGNAVDALLASEGYTNPNPKWRSRLLDLLSSQHQVSGLNSHSLSDIVWNAHQLPGLDKNSILKKSNEISTLCRRLFFIAECKIFFPELIRDASNSYLQIGYAQSDLLLELDVDYKIASDSVFVARLNEFGGVSTFDLGEIEILFDLNSFFSHAFLAAPVPHAISALRRKCQEAYLLDGAIMT